MPVQVGRDWVIVQSAKNQLANGAGLTFSATFSATPTVGNKVLAFVTEAATSTLFSTVKDGNAVALTNLATLGTALNGGVQGHFLLYDVPSPANATMTVTFSNLTGASSFVVLEVAGLPFGTSSALMLDGTWVTPVIATNSVPNSAYSSAKLNEMMLYVYMDNGESVTCTAASGYTKYTTSMYDADTNSNLVVFYKESAGGAEGSGCTVSGLATGECGAIKGALKWRGPVPVPVNGQAVPRAACR